MSRWRWPDTGSSGGRDTADRPPTGLWRAVDAVIAIGIGVAVGYAGWHLFRQLPYLIDTDVYRMGGQAWLAGRPLYADGVVFATQGGLDLPFTYPPLAAIVFSPLALVSLRVASVVITTITCGLLVVSMWIVLSRLRVPDAVRPGVGPLWLRRGWLSAGLVAMSMTWLEPIQANFHFGQINVVLMTLVIADCVPLRTPWPRGLLLGLAIALKLTPAVFLVYFVLRRDTRAALTAVASFVAATLLGFALAWRDSWEYWTSTVSHTDRIGTATLNTNQNAAGALARLGLDPSTHFVAWTMSCLLVLALTVWAVRRVLAAGESTLAVVCVAMFGLVVSPVSWSHHWVWALPTVIVTAVLGYRYRSAALAAVSTAGIALMVWTPIELLPEHREASAAWWRQLFGMSYVWWALAVITVAGVALAGAGVIPPQTPESAPPADLARRG